MQSLLTETFLVLSLVKLIQLSDNVSRLREEIKALEMRIFKFFAFFSSAHSNANPSTDVHWENNENIILHRMHH